jgi:hypothetical protein
VVTRSVSVINDIGLKRAESDIMSDIGSNFLSISDLRHPNLRVSMSESKEIGLDIVMDVHEHELEHEHEHEHENELI